MGNGSKGVVQLENEYFRVIEWTIEPGGVVPQHRHYYEFVVVPMVTDSMHIVQADGSEFVTELVAGKSYTRPAGSEHRIENRTSKSPIVFVEIERLT